MKNVILLLLFLCLVCHTTLWSQTSNNHSIIPEPLKVEERAGEFTLDSSTPIQIQPDNQELHLLAGMLADQLESVSGLSVAVATNSKRKQKAIHLILKPQEFSNKEGYRLTVSPDKIEITASEGNGVFYGLQSLFQLLPTKEELATSNQPISIPAVSIEDEPRYAWRGMMLDVGRFFYPVPFIKKFIDYLAMHKLNTFHWHLTEDHGWRIEIDQYPRLTEVSAWRNATQITPGGRMDHSLHGGYYTKEQIREVVDYASKRYVNVVPEIEMPGHALSALIAYPELSCIEGPFEFPERWAIQENIYCAGNEKTFEFLENVLTEVVELFPSPIIHIGGDEAPKKHWEACEKCQNRIAQEGLADEHELQSYFIKRIEDFLLTKNKNIIGWDEIMEGGLAPNAAVMSWRGTEGGIAAAKQHHNVVMTPTSYLYLDYYQGDPRLEPVAISHGPVVTLHRVYSFDPTPSELTPEEAQYILGVQGNIWAEFIHSPESVEYMGFPRGAALAEIAWSQPQNKDWENFTRKMEDQYRRYDDMGLNYAKSAYNVWHRVDENGDGPGVNVHLWTDSYQPAIFYTLDGSQPTEASARYTGPFTVDKPVMIKAATFKDGARRGAVSTSYVNQEVLSKS